MRVAIVTGAGTGIGAAVARILAKDDTAVVLVGRRPEPLATVARELRSNGADALEIPLDLACVRSAGEVVARTIESYGRIDVVVNNAAVLITRPFGTFPPEELDAQLAINLRAPFLLTQAALGALRQSGQAAVVNISSTAATTVRPEQSVYGMTKAALEYLTRSLAAELAPDIRVNAVAPGPTDTPILGEWFGSVTEAWKWLAPQTPLARIARPDEIAWWVARLCDASGAFVTGAVIPIDGGFSLDFR